MYACMHWRRRTVISVMFQKFLVRSERQEFLRVFHVHRNSRRVRRIFENPERRIGPRKRGSRSCRAADIDGDTCHPIGLQYPRGGGIFSVTANETAHFVDLYERPLRLWSCPFCDACCVIIKKVNRWAAEITDINICQCTSLLLVDFLAAKLYRVCKNW